MRVFRARIGPTIAFVPSAAVLSPASAQMNPIILAAPTSNSIGQVMKLRAEQMQREFDKKHASSDYPARGSRPEGSANAIHPALGISSDPGISAGVRRAFIGELAKSGGEAQASKVDNLFGNVHATFARAVRPYGLSADDLSDVMTAHLLVLWMAANQQTTLPTPAQVQAVRRQMVRVFAAKAGAIPDGGQRQSVAEYLMYETCLAILTREQIQSNPKLLATVADAADKKLLGQGISARTLELTERGLVHR